MISCELGYRRATMADMNRTDFFVVTGMSENGDPILEKSDGSLQIPIEK